MTEQSLINAVSQKLKQAFDKKMQSGGQQDAIKLLKEAYQLARSSSQLPPPWPQITAYRLAHLLMRSGEETDWKRVDSLLEEASGGDAILGAMPLIYRLVSLQKLHAPHEQLQDVYQAAVAQLKQQSPVLDKPRCDQGHLIQSNAVNLLEMAAYFIGLDYKSLEGRIELENDFFADLGVGQSAWLVLDSRQDGSAIAYPEAMARQIFAQRREIGDCLAIEYNGAAYLPDGRFEKKAFTEQQICNWYLRLHPPKPSKLSDKRKCDIGFDDSEEAERMRKKRFRDVLKKLGFILDESQFTQWWNKQDGCAINSPIDKPVIMLINPRFLKKPPSPSTE